MLIVANKEEREQNHYKRVKRCYEFLSQPDVKREVLIKNGCIKLLNDSRIKKPRPQRRTQPTSSRSSGSSSGKSSRRSNRRQKRQPTRRNKRRWSRRNKSVRYWTYWDIKNESDYMSHYHELKRVWLTQWQKPSFKQRDVDKDHGLTVYKNFSIYSNKSCQLYCMLNTG